MNQASEGLKEKEVDSGSSHRMNIVSVSGVSTATAPLESGRSTMKSGMQSRTVSGTPRAVKSSVETAVNGSVRQLDQPPYCVRRSGS